MCGMGGFGIRTLDLVLRSVKTRGELDDLEQLARRL